VKRIIFLFLLIKIGQVYAQSDIRLGVHIDPIVTWFGTKSTKIDKDGSRLGVSGGLIFESYFRPNYAFVTGISITSLGGNLLYNDSVNILTGEGTRVMLDAGTSVAYVLNYLTIPVALKMKSNQIGYFKYFAQLGLMPQFNIGTKATSTDGGLEKVNVPKEINLVNLSYFFGGGVEYNIGGNTELVAGLFYNNSFTDFLSNNTHQAIINFLTLRLGVIF
jgi:hypothetical protein